MAEAKTAAPLARVLLIDDSDGIRSFVASLLGTCGYEVDTAADGRRALGLIEGGLAPDVVLLDVMLPEMDGLETLRRIRALAPELPVVMLSVVGKAETIVEAMRAGAADFLNKPFDEEELLSLLERVKARPAAEGVSGPAGPRFEGPAWEEITAILEQIADVDVTVLIHGESGVGKEVVARAIHETSSRRAEPFVKVNCAALPGELLESELFGYERGAFTGATARRAGKFENAHGGTIFLDEIGEMSPAAQAKLLHVLQDATFSRLGGNQEIQVDVRVVSATNRPLEEMVARGGFREDLFFRLNVVNVAIPPLRERREEIPGLVDHFLARSAARYGRPRPELSRELQHVFERYPFPGNVRQLENLVKRIVVLGSEEAVMQELLRGDTQGQAPGGALRELLDEVERSAGTLPLREVGRRAALEAEREAIGQVLMRTGWNRKQAAQILGVSYKTLLQKIRDTGLRPD